MKHTSPEYLFFRILPGFFIILNDKIYFIILSLNRASLVKFSAYTQVNAKFGGFARRRPNFELALAALKAAKLKKFSEEGGCKSSDCLT